MIVIGSDAHRAHHAMELHGGSMLLSSEGPDRADVITTAMRAAGYTIEEPQPFDRSNAERVHTAEYLELLETAWSRWQELPDAGPAAMSFSWPSRTPNLVRPDDLIGQLGFHSFAADCSIVAGTWEAVTVGAAMAQTAVDRVSAGAGAAYALCRPPGHHATADQFGGYCYINNAAVAAQRLRDHGAERVAVLDVDYHHGNGTQSIFYGRSDVLTVSLHADPMFEFPWFVGHAHEHGDDDGAGWNLNVPLPRATSFADWSAALDPALERIKRSGAEALVVALGVDTFAEDPLGTFEFATADYASMATRIAELDMATVIVQEGGYAVDDIGLNVVSFLHGVA